MMADMVADMEVHMVTDMEGEKGADMVADMFADIVAKKGIQFGKKKKKGYPSSSSQIGYPQFGDYVANMLATMLATLST